MKVLADGGHGDEGYPLCCVPVKGRSAGQPTHKDDSVYKQSFFLGVSFKMPFMNPSSSSSSPLWVYGIFCGPPSSFFFFVCWAVKLNPNLISPPNDTMRPSSTQIKISFNSYNFHRVLQVPWLSWLKRLPSTSVCVIEWWWSINQSAGDHEFESRWDLFFFLFLVFGCCEILFAVQEVTRSSVADVNLRGHQRAESCTKVTTAVDKHNFIFL